MLCQGHNTRQLNNNSLDVQTYSDRVGGALTGYAHGGSIGKEKSFILQTSTEVPTHYEVSLSSGETASYKTKSCSSIGDNGNLFRKVYLVGSAYKKLHSQIVKTIAFVVVC